MVQPNHSPSATPRWPAGTTPDRPIALIGMMGVGKSSVGRRLAQRLDLPFVDADEEIETAAGMTIAEIFERHGEADFRDGERRVIARLACGPVQVIATGGGAFMQPATRALLLERTHVIWLRADVATLVQRVARRAHRPLLNGGDPRTVLTALAQQRDPIYALAPTHVSSDGGTHDAMVDRIVAALSCGAITRTGEQ